MPTGTQSKPKAETPLETVSIPNVEILATGTWNGDEYSKSDLADLVSAYSAGNAGIKPPVKLGHNKEQALLAADGYPAAGYVTSLKLSDDGTKVLANLEHVPAKIGRLIKAKAYKHVSAEVYFQLKHAGKVYPKVLKALSLLGADVPAVSSLADVEALYGRNYATLSQQPDGDVHTYTLPANTTYGDLQAGLCEALTERFGSGHEIEDIFESTVIVRIGGAQCYQMPYTLAADSALTIGMEMKAVESQTMWVPADAEPGEPIAGEDDEGEGEDDDEGEPAVGMMGTYAAVVKGGRKPKKLPKGFPWKQSGAPPVTLTANDAGDGGKADERAAETKGKRKPSQIAAAVGNLSADTDDEDFTATLAELVSRMDARHKGGKGMPALRAFAREMAGKLQTLKRQSAAKSANLDREANMDAQALKLLGLAEDADEATIATAITELKAKADTAHTYSDDLRKLSNDLLTVQGTLAKKDAAEAVETQVRAGKVTPAMREWAQNYALRDPEGFKQYTESAPTITLSGSGATAHATAAGTQGAADALSEAERIVAKQLGMDPAKVAEYKQRGTTRTS